MSTARKEHEMKTRSVEEKEFWSGLRKLRLELAWAFLKPGQPLPQDYQVIVDELLAFDEEEWLREHPEGI